MNTIFENTDYAFPIKLEQSHGSQLFKVTYGAQVIYGLTYEQAAKELGESLMHVLTCVGKVQVAD